MDKNKPRGDRIPAGATRQAFDRGPSPMGGPHASRLDDRHGAGNAGGGTEVGGLGGSNMGTGRPVEQELNEAMAGPVPDEAGSEEQGQAYAGISGGAVGGTPAQGRASGGNIGRGLSPGGTHRGDSTIGSKP